MFRATVELMTYVMLAGETSSPPPSAAAPLVLAVIVAFSKIAVALPIETPAPPKTAALFAMSESFTVSRADGPV